MANVFLAPPPDGKPLTCLIFGQERMFRELLASLLAIRAGIQVVAQTGRVVDGKRACKEHRPAVLLMALSPSEEDSLELAQEFLMASSTGHVVALVDAGAHFSPPPWLASRAVTVINRNEPLQAVWSALDRLVPRSRSRCTLGLRSKLGGRSLSQRESEVFTLIGEGLTNKQIAERLGLSDHTVRTHRKRIAAKLGTEGGELTHWAIVSRQASLATTAAD